MAGNGSGMTTTVKQVDLRQGSSPALALSAPCCGLEMLPLGAAGPGRLK